MDLHFDSPEAAAQCANSLRTWGEFMDANADRQCTGEFGSFSGGVCAVGAASLALGNEDPYDGYGEMATHGIGFEAQRAIAEIVVRQRGLRTTNYEIPFLNDVAGVTFPQFATACRTLAAMIEEHYVIESAPVAEHELVEA